MNAFERLAIRMRRAAAVRNADWLWRVVRPAYIGMLNVFGHRRGLERAINGTDRIRVIPELYVLPETYEPAFWACLMSEIRANDVVADVGAHLGLYTVALARRVGVGGRVVAAEPDEANLVRLRQNVRLNGVQGRVDVVPCAITDRAGLVSFVSGRDSESHVVLDGTGTRRIQSTTLDTLFPSSGPNVLKIDVEGFEEHVLRGAAGLLSRADNAPRAIFLELHPYAWADLGVTSRSLVDLLRQFGYVVTDVHDNPIEDVVSFGSVVARRSA
jgi:FkbM family methyltransferase